jgi:polyvinyl alcohol dehydrogenase (cytochrome)
MYGQNICNTASQVNVGIGKENVSKLVVKWQYDKKAGAAGDVSATPSVVGGRVYFPDWGGKINSLDAATGHVVWSKDVAAILTSAGLPGSLGGFVSRTTPLVTQGLVIFGVYRDSPQIATAPHCAAYVIAIDQNTGDLKWSQQLDTHYLAYIESSPVLEGNNFYIGVTSSEEVVPAVIGGLNGGGVKCCSFRGSIASMDVATGKINWQVYTISDELFYNTDAGVPEGGLNGAASAPGYSGASVWSSTPVIDRKRKQLIFTTGDNYKLPSADAPGTPPGNWVDSIVALDLATGNMNWARQLPNGGKGPSDAFAAGVSQGGADSDFGSGANLFTALYKGQPRDMVGAGQKSGVYFAVDAQTGDLLWQTTVGTGGATAGGMVWGTATDGTRIYTSDNNSTGANWTVLGKGSMAGQTVTTGVWSALDPATGDVIWQIPNPVLAKPLNAATLQGPVVVSNGVMFAGSMDKNGTMFALDAATGDVLWSFQSGGTVIGSPAIVNGMVFWGSGYPGAGGILAAKRPLGFGTSSTKAQFFAFGLP